MKKGLILVLLVTLFVSGCGNATKTCTMTQDGNEMTLKMTAKDETINKIDMEYVMTAESLGMTSFEELDDETKEDFETNFLSLLGIEEGAKGITVDVEYKKTEMIVNFTIDVEKADKEILSNFDFDEENLNLDENVKGLEEAGYTCK